MYEYKFPFFHFGPFYLNLVSRMWVSMCFQLNFQVLEVWHRSTSNSNDLLGHSPAELSCGEIFRSCSKTSLFSGDVKCFTQLFCFHGLHYCCKSWGSTCQQRMSEHSRIFTIEPNSSEFFVDHSSPAEEKSDIFIIAKFSILYNM